MLFFCRGVQRYFGRTEYPTYRDSNSCHYTNGAGHAVADIENSTITEAPACDYLTLHIRLESADAVIFTASKVLTISSMDGNVRYDLGRHQLSKGLNSIPVGLGHLPNGLYAFHFVSTDRQHTTRISLQKN